MMAWRMASLPEPVGGRAAAAQVPAPAAALSRFTRSCVAPLPLFSISIRPTTSAPRPLMAGMILSRWRVSSAALSAPRQSLRVPLGKQEAPDWSMVLK